MSNVVVSVRDMVGGGCRHTFSVEPTQICSVASGDCDGASVRMAASTPVCGVPYTHVPPAGSTMFVHVP